MRNRVLLIVAVLAGLAIMYVDSRPGWDDTGITVFAMLGAAGICGLIAPRRPWVWALAVGVWIPLHALMQTGSARSLAMFVTLAFPLAGAYTGTAVRRALG